MKNLIPVSLLFICLNAAAQPGDMYIYPAEGQDQARVEQDRYECYVWASRESGFDPSRAGATRPARLIQVPVAENPNRGATAKGTVIGAIAGVALRDSHEGAAVGAVLGTIAGAVIENEGHRQAEAEARAEAIARSEHERTLADGHDNYRRAFSACLEGRGYVVR